MYIKMIIFLSLLFSMVYSEECLPFIKSTSIRGNVSASLHAILNLNVNHVRIYLNWNIVQPTLVDPLETRTVAQLRKHTGWIDPLIREIGNNWKVIDDQIVLLKKHGIDTILEIGEGTTHCLPTYNGAVINPDSLGTDRYLALIYKYARASVRRYKHQVKLWQIENELNEAYYEALTGIRQPATLTDNVWADWEFLTNLLSTLYLAVKDEDSRLLTTQNVHTDIPKSVHDYLDFPGFYLDAVNDWQNLMDIVSFDSYPNYVIGNPIYPEVLGNKTKAIIQLLKSNHNLKPVMVMETGYSVAADPSIVPPPVQYTDDNQSDFYKQGYKSVVHAGGSGFGIFGTWPNPGFNPPTGGYTDDDIEALEIVNNVLQTGDILPFLEWLATHPDDINRLLETILVIENGWGIQNADGTPRKAYTTLSKLFKYN